MSVAAQRYQPKPGSRINGSPRLADPRNVNSQLGPADFIIPEYDPDRNPANSKYAEPGHDMAVLRMMQDRITSAISYKRIKEPVWYKSLAFYLGTQDVTWNFRYKQLVPLRTAGNVYKSICKRNKIRPKVKKLTYQAFAQKPDAAIKPATASDLNRQAAAEGRAGLAHLDYKFHRDQQTRRLGHWALITGTVANKITWNETAAAEMPQLGTDPITGEQTVEGSSIEPDMGDVHEQIVPIFELLMDPEARDYCGMGWIIHQHVYDLSYIRERWPNGIFVKADTGQGIAGYVESRLAAVLGEYMRGTEPGPVKHNTAVIYECHEPPTPGLYDSGRTIICSMNVMLQYDEEWPNMDAKQLATMGICVPYAFMHYEECPGSLYGIGVVQDMLSPQEDINECVSREVDHLKTSWGKLLIEEGSRVPANSFDDARPNEKITYARGSTAPQHVDPPPLPEWIAAIKAQAEADLDDISLLHESSDGQNDNQDSGVVVAKMQSADAKAGSMFAANIEEYHRQRATIELHLLGRNYIEPRLIFISEGYFGDPAKKMNIAGTPAAGAPASSPGVGPLPPGPGVGPLAPNPAGTGPMMPGAPPMPAMGSGTVTPPMPPYTDDPDSAAMDVKSFKALNNGGSCHVVITPGSALAKDTEAMKQEILLLFKLGMFGPPGDPTTAGIVLSLLDYAGSDEIVDAIRKAAMDRLRFQMMMAPNPQNVEATKQAGALALDQAKGAREIALENAKQQHEGAVLGLKDHLDQQKAWYQATLDAFARQQEQTFTLHQALLDKLHPEVRLTGQISPIETAGAMATIGFPVPDMPQLAQAAQAAADTASAGATNAQKMAAAPLPPADDAAGGDAGDTANSGDAGQPGVGPLTPNPGVTGPAEPAQGVGQGDTSGMDGYLGA